MRQSRFTEEQIIGVLREQEAGAATADVRRKHGISPATFCQWKAKFGGLEVSEARRLRTLESENARLKKLLAEARLDNAMLKGVAAKNGDARREAGAHLRALHEVRERRACLVLGADRSTVRSRSIRPEDGDLRARLRSLAVERRRFGYRRLGLLLAHEGLRPNHKKLRRLYREERLQERRRGGRKRALGVRAPVAAPDAANRRWSLDFASDISADGRRFRILCVVDDFSRECLALVSDTSLSGLRVARELDAIGAVRGLPSAVISDNGTELTSTASSTLVAGSGRGLALHRPGQAPAERVRAEVHRPTARRMPERDSIHLAAPGARGAVGVAARLQRGAAALRAGRPDAQHGRDRETALDRTEKPCHDRRDGNRGLYF